MQIVSLLIVLMYSLTITASPCNDSTFLSLRSQAPFFSSKNDSVLYENKKEECESYSGSHSEMKLDSLSEAKQDSVAKFKKDKKWAERKPLIIAGIVCGVVAGIVAIVIIKSLAPSNVKVSIFGFEI